MTVQYLFVDLNEYHLVEYLRIVLFGKQYLLDKRFSITNQYFHFSLNNFPTTKTRFESDKA